MLLELLLVIIILGLLAWGIKVLPIAEPFKTIAYVILCIIAVIYLFRNVLGVTLNL